jgi:hypothetical protein
MSPPPQLFDFLPASVGQAKRPNDHPSPTHPIRAGLTLLTALKMDTVGQLLTFRFHPTTCRTATSRTA